MVCECFDTTRDKLGVFVQSTRGSVFLGAYERASAFYLYENNPAVNMSTAAFRPILEFFGGMSGGIIRDRNVTFVVSADPGFSGSGASASSTRGVILFSAPSCTRPTRSPVRIGRVLVRALDATSSPTNIVRQFQGVVNEGLMGMCTACDGDINGDGFVGE
jgi:hypothetical protein